jgi:hypothetical protein
LDFYIFTVQKLTVKSKTMKTLKFILPILFFIFSNGLKAQDSTVTTPFSYGADLVSRYIFRGLDYGDSPAIQPAFSFTKKGFTIGAWGSYAFIATPTGIEADIYASYEFDFGLSVGVTDYYFPGEMLTINPDSTISPVRKGTYFDYANTHYDELNVTQSIGNFDLSGNWGFHNMDNALYFEAEYTFKWISAFIGAGNKLYTSNSKFNVVNLGIKATKEINITPKYAFGLSSAVILNPEAEQIHLVFGLSL